MSTIKLNQNCYATLQFEQPWTYDNYRKIGGYQAWEKILAERTPGRDHRHRQGLRPARSRRRGLPRRVKWSFMPKGEMQKYIVCNSDESEPGTCKDRDILRFNPHALVEGMAIAGYAIGATVGYNYMRGEFMDEPARHFQQALADAYAAGLLGKNIRGTGIDFDLHDHLGAGAYICGEETALLESLEGKKGQPRFKPPFPASYGLYGQPTTINNTESLSSVPAILRNGAEWFAAIGKPNNGGTKIFSVSGHVNKPGNYEIPMGTPFRDLLDLAGGVLGGRALKAVIPGGSSVPVLPAAAMLEADMDYDSISKAGSMLGSGAVIVMDETTDMVRCCVAYHASTTRSPAANAPRVAKVRAGSTACSADRRRAGQAGGSRRLDLVASKIEGRTICALGDAAAMPVRSFVKHFRHEFAHYIEHGHSILEARGQSAAA